MRSMLRQAHAVAAWVLVASIVYQVFLAGAAITNLGGSGDFSNHAGFGFLIGLVVLIVLVLAIAAGRGRRDIGIAFLLLVLYVIQTGLPSAKGTAAALHPVNAMLLFGLSTWYAWHAWTTRNADAPAVEAS